MATTTKQNSTKICSRPGRCVAIKTLNLLGKKWSLAMLFQLCQGSKRFGELQRALPGISPRTLTIRLQELEKHGIVHRRVYDEMPLRVEYRLTEKGRSLKDVVGQVHAWGERYA